jgi:hypothetical protein
MMPATVMIQFIVATGVSPNWLLSGMGERFTPAETFDQRIKDRFKQAD